MVLRRDVAGLEVADKSDVVSMNRGHTNKLGSTGPWLPLGNLVSNRSELGFQHLGRTAPGMGISECRASGRGASEILNGGDAELFVRSVVLQVDSVGDGEGP